MDPRVQIGGFSHLEVAAPGIHSRSMLPRSRDRLHGLGLGLTCALLLLACGDNGGGTSASAASTSGEAGSSTQPSPTTAGPATSDTPTGGSGSDSASATTTGDPTLTSSGPASDPTTTPQTSTDPSTSDATTDATTGDSTTGGTANVVRFVALGDTGEGNEAQYAVGQAIAELCAQKGCDFGLLLGDNFYDSGVTSVDDPQFQDKFELPYEDLDFPIYVVLGNHDYGGAGIGVDLNFKKSQYQVDYTKLSQTWKMPAKYYSFKQEHAEFWGLDTNQIMTDPINGNSAAQVAWLVAGVGASTATWKIGFGHHPYISNGDHGNAGDYENLEGIPFDFVTGAKVKAAMETAVCGKIDVFISGHDHNLQWLEPKCGTEWIVSGAGSKAEPLPGTNPAYYAVPNIEGFMWVELMDNSFTGIFYDQTGKELFSKTLMK